MISVLVIAVMAGVVDVTEAISKQGDNIGNLKKEVEQLQEVNKNLIQENEALKKASEELNTKFIDLEKKVSLRQQQIAKAQVTTASVKPSYKSGVEQWRSEVSKYGWNVNEALIVMSRESGGNPKAVSRTNDHGLYQIHNGLAVYGDKIYDPAFNISLAYNNYYKTRGWTPWYCCRELWY